MRDNYTKVEKGKKIWKPLKVSDKKGDANSSKGRILRIKLGYNPNSSSMGSIVFVLPCVLLGITAGFGVISGIITSTFIKSADEKNQKKEHIQAQKNDSQSSPKGN